MKLKIFSQRDFIPSDLEPVPLLYPFWKDLYSSEYRSWISPFEKYKDSGQAFFEMTELENCDFAVMPIDWRDVRGDTWYASENKFAKHLALQFAELVKSVDKPLIVFFGSDCSDEVIPIKNAIVFRQSPYRSLIRKGKSFPFPFFCEDFVKHYLNRNLPIRDKHSTPVVGFCGLAKPISLRKHIQTPLYHSYMFLKQRRIGVSPYKGHSIRRKALDILEANDKVNTNFIVRQKAAFFEDSGSISKKDIRLQYVENIVNSDYTLCIRGAGNYSNRFYEVLSCGRIPIFVDTDCVLPWNSYIDWDKHTVSLEERELNTIADKVLDFHNQLSPEDFIDVQHSCRKIWEEWLAPEGFFAQLYLYLQGFLE